MGTEFASRLKAAMAIRNMKQVDLCSATGIPKSAMSQYLSGSFEPKQTRLWKMATALEVDEAWLMGYDVPMERKKEDPPLPPSLELYAPKGQMPLLGRVAAGLPMYAEENIEGYIANDFTDGEIYYALRVHGDSMNAAGIDTGDIVVVRQQGDVEEHEIGVILVNGNDATIKFFRQQENMAILTPRSTNPIHQVQIYDIRETPIRIIGRVVQVRKNL